MERFFEDSVPGSSENRFVPPWVNVPNKNGNDVWGISHGSFSAFASANSLFSSSLPILPHEKLNVADSDHSHQSSDDAFPFSNKLYGKSKDTLKGIEPKDIGCLLPGDENELLGGIMDDFDLSGLPNKLEDLEDDFFGSGGGMELDVCPHPQEAPTIDMSMVSISDGFGANGVVHYGLPNGVASVVGEHPYGEHPSRTLFVRNINSNVEDSELKSLFEEYGDIRTLYTACKHRGFVMISYYDIRSARIAMRSLQNKPLRRRKLDIHFSIPKDNPSEKDANQGTLVAFNLDASVSNDDLLQIFGAYGEVKEIRETPHKRHHKFIEFYDVRAADAALQALNRCDIAGKRIKLEPSRPGGARRNFMQQLNQELEQDESRIFRHQKGSPVTNSPPGNWGQIGSPVEQNLLRALGQSQSLGAFSPISSNHLPGLASILPNQIPNSSKISPIGKYQGGMDYLFTSGNSSDRPAYQHSHSFPDQKFRASSGELNSSSSSIGTLSGPEFLWGSPTLYSEQTSSSAWSTSSSGQTFVSNGQKQSLPYLSEHRPFVGSPHHHHHVGSAPSFMSRVGFGGIDPSLNIMNRGAQGLMSPNFRVPGTVAESGTPNFRMMSLPMHDSIYFRNVSFPALVATSDCHAESNKQYQLNLENIIRGEDTRTTLMIKNIPNKYTSMMLLASIDENHRGTYNFLYLPIDFKNKCNVGYAFINMVSPDHIPSFYKEFNAKKWEKFNSEKVASLAYARIQGKAALVTHFHNSGIMNEDRRRRPILFNVNGQLTADQELYPSSNLNIRVRQPDSSYGDDWLNSLDSILDEKTEMLNFDFDIAHSLS